MFKKKEQAGLDFEAEILKYMELTNAKECRIAFSEIKPLLSPHAPTRIASVCKQLLMWSF